MGRVAPKILFKASRSFEPADYSPPTSQPTDPHAP